MPLNCTDQCSVDEVGKCYCEKYEELYNSIKNSNIPMWWTITLNDKKISEEDPDKIQKYLFENYLNEIQYCSDKLICVTEYSIDYRQHYHLFLSITNKKRFKILTNQITKFIGINKPLDGAPAKGIHYLFKSINKSKSVMDTAPINLISDFKDILYNQQLERKKLKQLQKELLLKEQVTIKQTQYNSIPKWMQEDINSDEE